MNQFNKIGIYGRHRKGRIGDTLQSLVQLLATMQCEIFIEEQTAQMVKGHKFKEIPYQELGKNCDLVIVVGGDGNMLHAARTVVKYQTPLIGINRGRLGFLTDISPDNLEIEITSIIKGQYVSETRFLLTAQIQHNKKFRYENDAFNDVVLLPGKYAHMINFDLYINQQLVCEHRADGLIISTPTGSTAYSLSGGGPILEPALEAIVLVPMFPHTLSSRPIVVHSDDIVELYIRPENETSPYISCDGQERMEISPGERLVISKKKQRVTLLHPVNYNYYQTLRTKLGWLTHQ